MPSPSSPKEQFPILVNKTVMKKEWQKFEIECLEYLKNKFGQYGDFELIGGEDSTMSDIMVTLPNGVRFFIEVKKEVAQCSQFVLIPDHQMRTFAYSSRNKLPMNPFTKNIIGYMNEHFDEFAFPGASGTKIDPLLAASAGHIRYQHMMKGVEFFITRHNDFILLPLSLFSYYFEIMGVYRTKKSGSSPLPKKDDDAVNLYLAENYGFECERNGQDFYAPVIPDLIGAKFSLEQGNYNFTELGDGRMGVRKLSDTNNGTVIFSVRLKEGVTSLPDDFFIAFMKMAAR